MKRLPVDHRVIKRMLDSVREASADFGNKRQEALWKDTMASGFDTWLYCGMTIELKFFDYAGHAWLEADFLTPRKVFVWRQDGRKTVPARVRSLIKKHGYGVYDDFEKLPRRFRSLLTC